MKKLIALYRDAVRDDWARPTDATFANIQEAEENILSVIDKLGKKNKRLKEEALAGQKTVNAILNIGHNDDCLFCGLKDKIAKEAIK